MAFPGFSVSRLSGLKSLLRFKFLGTRYESILAYLIKVLSQICLFEEIPYESSANPQARDQKRI